jgi:glutamate carboxypeptidase
MPPTAPVLLDPREIAALRSALESAEPAFLADLERLVNTDSGSYTKVGVDVIGRWTAERLRSLGARVTSYPNDQGLGETIVAEFAGTDPRGPVLLCIGHMDTVFDEGTALERPFEIQAGIATGPGVTDMKSGLLAGLYAIDALRTTLGGLPLARLVFVANPDEEIGSPVSSSHIRRIAADADACFVLECARANGDIVSSRKGTLDLVITVNGRAAHAGVEPEKGRSAILEAARIVTELHALNGRWPGVTVNVGVIGGGTRPNVVAERCVMEVDLRAVTRDSLVEAEAAISAITAPRVVPEVTTEIEETGTGPWRSSSDRGTSLATRSRWQPPSGSRCAIPRRAVPPMRTRPPAWTSRRSTAWVRSAGWTILRASTWRLPRSCRARCSWRR